MRQGCVQRDGERGGTASGNSAHATKVIWASCKTARTAQGLDDGIDEGSIAGTDGAKHVIPTRPERSHHHA